MTIDEYRAKHKRCKTCAYVEETTLYLICTAKNTAYYRDGRLKNVKGCFCRLYKAKEFKE